MSKIYIVGTPIGNMKDITYRAVETLQNVDIIACEDTRVTKKLLDYWQISKKTLTYNKMNEKNSAEGLIKLLLDKDLNLALVSDAGMPLISDPGFELVKQANENNIPVEIIPGVNAAITALALSGLASEFVFLGFPKEKTKQREDQLAAMETNFAYIFYLSPHKITYFLDDVETIWQDQAQIFLVKELTKMFETQYRGSAKELKTLFSNQNIKGEFTAVIKLKSQIKEKVNKYAALAGKKKIV
ncbi:16S rRNA (cytidine(1402)-2'-O)-methyltransferase [Mycoplasmopsis iners]|uniref:16S rRNA (cytidine(1402)-2'-O)-methyltransferase n=1 Tax=Mycoplasmopsis iners TaxID=76630 RepID=UPI0004984182|nr:16S rRNA (cytidine(1402)-2'-O)-methyltransferase [Mycoplasmopsis iners]